MSNIIPEDAINSILQPIIRPWYESIENPQKAQEQVLNELLKQYAKTEYGQSHHAHEITGIPDYQKNFPIIDYKELTPYLTQVKEGNYKAILPEPAVSWVMTRGSTWKIKSHPRNPNTPETDIHMRRKSTNKLRTKKKEL